MFLFKSKRNYLHSTDIYTYLKNNYNFSKIDLKFYNFIISQPSLKIISNKNPNLKNCSIAAKITNHKKSKFVLFFKTKKKICSHYSYDENLMFKFFKRKKDQIECNFKTSINYIDIIVSMSKYWHIMSISKKKKWIVYRICINVDLAEKINKNILIKNEKINNRKNTISSIFIDNKNIGKIYYSHL